MNERGIVRVVMTFLSDAQVAETMMDNLADLATDDTLINELNNTLGGMDADCGDHLSSYLSFRS